MRRTIEAFIGERKQQLGTLYFNRQRARESSAFEYADAWLESPDRFAIDPALPLVGGPQYPPLREGTVFHAAIADTEPDGWAKDVILRDHAKRRQAGEELPPLTAIDYLLTVDDVARLGALRFRDEGGVFQRAAGPGRRTPPLLKLGEIFTATRAVEMHEETASDLAYLRGRGTSLGGLRPKCSVLDDDGRLAIGKFPSVQDTRPVTKGEVLALDLARLAGIDVARARLVDSDGIPVALVRRFDRTPDGARLMYVSAATLLGADPRHEHWYTEIVDAIRQYGADPVREIKELWRRIAFSIAITNVDDHLMNHGFLHTEGGTWKLAPAFDLNPFPDRVRELKVWISEDTGPSARVEDLIDAAPYFGLESEEAARILGEVEGAVSKWRTRGKAIGMTRAELDLFEPAFEHAERAEARAASR